jgi:uncharacterized protein YutE (UPF0331/DUF86 family)
MIESVEKVINGFEMLISDLENEISWFENHLPQLEENIFAFVHKHAIVARDHLRNYRDWPECKIKEKFVEYRERLTMVVVSAFIFSLSAIEYSLKLIIKKSKDGPLVNWVEAKKQENRFRIYLFGIMKESKRKKLIDKSELDSWKGMIELRNAIMHNNAFFDEDTSFKIGDMTFEADAGNMVRYPMSDRPKIIKALVSLTRSWIEAYLKSHII